jgi:predicted amidophosphoribosyltransferase
LMPGLATFVKENDLSRLRTLREWISVCERKTAVCPNCNLERHDVDANYCKRCGRELNGNA